MVISERGRWEKKVFSVTFSLSIENCSVQWVVSWNKPVGVSQLTQLWNSWKVPSQVVCNSLFTLFCPSDRCVISLRCVLSADSPEALFLSALSFFMGSLSVCWSACWWVCKPPRWLQYLQYDSLVTSSLILISLHLSLLQSKVIHSLFSAEAGRQIFADSRRQQRGKRGRERRNKVFEWVNEGTSYIQTTTIIRILRSIDTANEHCTLVVPLCFCQTVLHELCTKHSRTHIERQQQSSFERSSSAFSGN